jgi:hypothetical protein
VLLPGEVAGVGLDEVVERTSCMAMAKGMGAVLAARHAVDLNRAIRPNANLEHVVAKASDHVRFHVHEQLVYRRIKLLEPAAALEHGLEAVVGRYGGLLCSIGASESTELVAANAALEHRNFGVQSSRGCCRGVLRLGGLCTLEATQTVKVPVNGVHDEPSECKDAIAEAHTCSRTILSILGRVGVPWQRADGGGGGHANAAASRAT